MDRDGLRTLKVQASHIYPGLTVTYVNLAKNHAQARRPAGRTRTRLRPSGTMMLE
jgi:hypothetical protein